MTPIHRPIRILVVDDEEDDLLLTKDVIEQGMREESVIIDQASSCADALARMEESRYDVLLVDYRLGAEYGLRLVRDARARGLTTPAILLTGHGDEDIAVAALKAGVADYLLKPKLTPEVLHGAIHHAVDLHEREARRRQAEERLAKINECFLRFGPDSNENINRLTALCGELLDGTAALYRHVEGSALHTLGRWRAPAQAHPVEPVEGGICQDLVQSAPDTLLVLRHLQETPYARADPRLSTSGLETYIGKAVKCGATVVGVLCVVYRWDVVPNKADERLLSIIASAIRVEEERKQAQEALRQSEEQLRHAQKMEAVGRLAGGIAHDFNNLLTVISGYTEIMLRAWHRTEPQRKNLEALKTATDQAASLVQQLMAFSRKQVLLPKILDLNAVVTKIAHMLHRVIGEDIELITVLGSRLGCVKTDPGQIEQVIMNLVVNARDAMSRGGKLTIETANVEVHEAESRRHVGMQPGSYVMLAIGDTGCGMDAETLARIFEPFFTTKEPGKGTGLGLAMVYGFVNQSGGHLGVSSEPARGTTFKIYLPRVDAVIDVPEPLLDPSRPPRGTETVLLVEDKEEVRILVRAALRSQGYHVLEAGHGEEALKISHEYAGRIDLMVTDVVMPGMSGPQLAQHLAPLRPEMQVLYMSGYSDSTVMPQSILEAGTPFLPKPFTPDTLAYKVRDVLDAPAPSHAARVEHLPASPSQNPSR